jgi:hypothetical protein
MGFRSHMQMSHDLMQLAGQSSDVREYGAMMRALGAAGKPRQMIMARDAAAKK